MTHSSDTSENLEQSLADRDIASAVLTLVNIMRQLRDPNDGCPWDLAQTHELESLRDVAEEVLSSYHRK